MAVKRKSEQVLSYLKVDEREELDVAVAELEVSRADLIRQCILDYLERRREGLELLAAAGDIEVISVDGTVVRNGETVLSGSGVTEVE